MTPKKHINQFLPPTQSRDSPKFVQVYALVLSLRYTSNPNASIVTGRIEECLDVSLLNSMVAFPEFSAMLAAIVVGWLACLEPGGYLLSCGDSGEDFSFTFSLFIGVLQG